MVDAGLPALPRDNPDAAGATFHDHVVRRGAITVEAARGPDALAAYRTFSAAAVCAPPQSALWIDAWARHCNGDMLIVTVSSQGRRRLALALEVVRENGCTVARFAGGSHANGNFPALMGGGAPALGDADRRAVAGAVRAMRPDVDLLVLERQVARFAGLDNPLAPLASWRSPNVALAVDLAPGFARMLDSPSGKRRRKKHRSQTRKLDAAGGYARVTAASPAETDRLLDAFFRMKAARFAAMGISDVFAAPAIRGFFRELFGRATAGGARPDFVLHGLEVGGTLRAVTGSSRTPFSIICEFGSIADDELSNASPGEFLFYKNIEEACAEGLALYDFSVGDEAYKRIWCDVETHHFDVAIPVSVRGRLQLGMRHAMVGAKRFVKTNPRLMALVRRLRRREAATPPAIAPDGD
jgi:CelD/BcsL family acetyltransferase involved in cellulose biosynthesis